MLTNRIFCRKIKKRKRCKKVVHFKHAKPLITLCNQHNNISHLNLHIIENSPFKERGVFMVPVIGVEPIRYRYHWILSPARLPIPSHRHISSQTTWILYYNANKKSSVFLIFIYCDFPFFITNT